MFPDIEDERMRQYVFGQMVGLIAVSILSTAFMVFFLLAEGIAFRSIALLLIAAAATAFAVHFHTKITEYRNRQD